MIGARLLAHRKMGPAILQILNLFLFRSLPSDRSGASVHRSRRCARLHRVPGRWLAVGPQRCTRQCDRRLLGSAVGPWHWGGSERCHRAHRCRPIESVLSYVAGTGNRRAALRVCKSIMGPEWWLKLLYATLFGVVVMMQTVFMPVLLLPCIKVGDKTLREFVSRLPTRTRRPHHLPSELALLLCRLPRCCD